MLNTATATIFGTIPKVEKADDGKWLRVTIPVNESWVDKNDKRHERTSWFEAVSFNTAQIQLFEKLNVQGRYVRLEANVKIGTDELEGKQIKKTTFQISRIDLLDPKPAE